MSVKSEPRDGRSGSSRVSTRANSVASEDSSSTHDGHQQQPTSRGTALSKRSSGQGGKGGCAGGGDGRLQYSYEFLKKLQKSKLSRKAPECITRLRQENILRDMWRSDKDDRKESVGLEGGGGGGAGGAGAVAGGVQLDLGMSRRSFVAGCQIANIPTSESKTPTKLLGGLQQSQGSSLKEPLAKEPSGNTRRIGSGRLERTFKDARGDRDRDYGYGAGSGGDGPRGGSGRLGDSATQQMQQRRSGSFDYVGGNGGGRSGNSRADGLLQRSGGGRRSDNMMYNYSMGYREDEPEWFTEGPTSQNETIELGGFEDHQQRQERNERNEQQQRQERQERQDQQQRQESSGQRPAGGRSMGGSGRLGRGSLADAEAAAAADEYNMDNAERHRRPPVSSNRQDSSERRSSDRRRSPSPSSHNNQNDQDDQPVQMIRTKRGEGWSGRDLMRELNGGVSPPGFGNAAAAPMMDMNNADGRQQQQSEEQRHDQMQVVDFNQFFLDAESPNNGVSRGAENEMPSADEIGGRQGGGGGSRFMSKVFAKAEHTGPPSRGSPSIDQQQSNNLPPELQQQQGQQPIHPLLMQMLQSHGGPQPHEMPHHLHHHHHPPGLPAGFLPGHPGGPHAMNGGENGRPPPFLRELLQHNGDGPMPMPPHHMNGLPMGHPHHHGPQPPLNPIEALLAAGGNPAVVGGMPGVLPGEHHPPPHMMPPHHPGGMMPPPLHMLMAGEGPHHHHGPPKHMENNNNGMSSPPPHDGQNNGNAQQMNGKMLLELLLSGGAGHGAPSPPPPHHAKSVDELEANLKMQSSRPMMPPAHHHQQQAGFIMGGGPHGMPPHMDHHHRNGMPPMGMPMNGGGMMDLGHMMGGPHMGGGHNNGGPIMHPQDQLNASQDIMRLLTSEAGNNSQREPQQQQQPIKPAFKQDLKNVPTQVLLREKDLLSGGQPRPIVKNSKTNGPPAAAAAALPPTSQASNNSAAMANETGAELLQKLLQAAAGQPQPSPSMEQRGGAGPQATSTSVSLNQLFGIGAPTPPPAGALRQNGVPRPLTGGNGNPGGPQRALVGGPSRQEQSCPTTSGGDDALARWFGNLGMGAGAGNPVDGAMPPPVPRNVLRVEDLERRAAPPQQQQQQRGLRVIEPHPF